VARVAALNARGGSRPTVLPPARGPLSGRLFEHLRHEPSPVAWKDTTVGADEDDLHLALYCCYELHYQGLAGVHPEWEWEPSLLAFRRRLEDRFLADLREMTGHLPESEPATVIPRLWEMATAEDGPSLSRWVDERASLEQVREFAIHRSAYQLKEADPHTWALPRLSGAPKAAMLAIQADEYGGGVTGDMHATLFTQTMAGLGLDPAASYLDLIPGLTLATTNLMSLFGLHRRWRGALVGHLALFEMTSVGPMGRYARALRRLGVDEDGCRFYDVHVEADEVHQHIATDDMVGGLLRLEPDLAADILFGASALGAVEARFSRHLLSCWKAGRSSLRPYTVGRVA
jgi:hypothetical protein